jgi:hypothetical protein
MRNIVVLTLVLQSLIYATALWFQGVRFVRGTHLLFTASKDKTLKYWDADRFEKVLLVVSMLLLLPVVLLMLPAQLL